MNVSFAQHIRRSTTFLHVILQHAHQRLTGYLFILPAVVLEGLFFGYPLLRTMYISLHNWPVLGPKRYIGLENYDYILSNDQFWETLRFTGLYTVLVTPAIFIVAFGLAVLVNRFA